MAKLFCFSATGNSLHLAKTLADPLRAQIVSISSAPGVCDDEVIGFVFPVYYLGLPKSVARYITGLTITHKSPYLFAVASYGGKGQGALRQAGQLLKGKGHRLQYGQYIKSVENYISLYSLNNEAPVHKNQDEALQRIRSDVASKTQTEMERLRLSDKLSYLAFPGNNGHQDKHFTLDGHCTGCGVCATICPQGNINVKPSGPCFLHQCEHCFACVHACPFKVINWKASTQGKERYRNPNIRAKELIDFCGKKTPHNL